MVLIRPSFFYVLACAALVGCGQYTDEQGQAIVQSEGVTSEASVSQAQQATLLGGTNPTLPSPRPHAGAAAAPATAPSTNAPVLAPSTQAPTRSNSRTETTRTQESARPAAPTRPQAPAPAPAPSSSQRANSPATVAPPSPAASQRPNQSAAPTAVTPVSPSVAAPARTQRPPAPPSSATPPAAQPTSPAPTQAPTVRPQAPTQAPAQAPAAAAATATAESQAPATSAPTAVSPEPTHSAVRLGSREILESGSITPTVYYVPIINEDKVACRSSEMLPLFDELGKEIIRVCQATRDRCLMEGTCAVEKRGRDFAINYVGLRNGRRAYALIPEDGCRFGFGVKASCLDPYYTLAADLKIYKPGDVIYIPAVAGLELPGGSKHNGFFIVRDRGNGIVGRGRFDFFTGYLSWRHPENPFAKIGMNSKLTRIPYYRIAGPRADQIRSARSYPRLPQVVISAGEPQD